MDLTPLQTLKHRLRHDKELAPVWSFFLDQIAGPEFMRLGNPTQHAFVEAVVARVAKQLFPQGAGASQVILNRLADEKFIHGGFFVDGRPGGVIFFEDSRMGLIAITNLPPSLKVEYVRFSLPPGLGAGPPSRN